MGTRFSGDDVDNWKPKPMRRYKSLTRKSQQTQEYIIISDKIDKNTLHLTREPSKHSRLNYMQALCTALNHNNDNNENKKNKNQIIKSLSIWNWRFLGSNEKYMSRLAQALQNNIYIDTLHLVNCHIDGELKIRILIESLKRRNVALKDIDLSGNNFGNDESAIRLLGIFLSTYHCTQKLQNITLRATKLQDEQFTNLVQILSESHTLLDSMKLFSVTHNKLKEESMQYLTKWLLSKERNKRYTDTDVLQNTDILIKHLSTFQNSKLLNLCLTTNPIKDCGAKALMPLLQSDICISELHLRSCCITIQGIMYLLDAYMIRQQRVIQQYTKLIYDILHKHNDMDIPCDLCWIIIECISDWTLDDRLKIHFGLSRCSLLMNDGFNVIMEEYIMNRKLIVKCLDVRMKDTQQTEINIVNIYRLFHYLRYIGNGNIGRLMFCVSTKMFDITNELMQLLPTNITERDIDVVINDIIYEGTKYRDRSRYCNEHMGDVVGIRRELNTVQNLNESVDVLMQQQNALMTNINYIMMPRHNRKKKKMEDILGDDNENSIGYDNDEDEKGIVDGVLLEELYKVHVELKQDRLWKMHNNDDITFQLNVNSDYGDFDLTHFSYTDVFGDQPLGFVV